MARDFEQLSIFNEEEQAELEQGILLQADKLFEPYKKHKLVCDAFQNAVNWGAFIKQTDQLFSPEELNLWGTIQDKLNILDEEEDKLYEDYCNRYSLDLFENESARVIQYRQTDEYIALYEQVKRWIDAQFKIKCIGWLRYAEQRSYDELLSDLETILQLRFGDYFESDGKKVNVPYSAHLQYDTDLFFGQTMILQMQLFGMDYTGQREYIRLMLREHIYHQLTALDYRQLSREQADQLIEDAITDIQNGLNDNAGTGEVRDIVPAVQLNPLTNYVQTKDKISRLLPKLERGKRTPIRREPKSSKNPKHEVEITTFCTLNYTGDDDLDMQFLRQVFWALLTEQENGNNATTSSRINDIITKSVGSRPSLEQQDKIIDYCNKLNDCELIIDATQESKHYGYKQLGIELTGKLGAVTIAQTKVNGQIMEKGVLFSLDVSPLMIYARSTNEISSTPMNYLTQQTVSKKAEVTNVEDYLIYRIESIGRIGSNDNRILIDKLLEDCGIVESEYSNKNTYITKRKRLYKKIRSILDGYIVTGYIKSYKEIKRGSYLYCVEIDK